MRQRSIILLIFSLGVALNGIGYAVYRGLRARRALSTLDLAIEAGLSAEKREADARGRALRAEGVSALAAGDYDRALARFVEAQASMGERADVAELLRITQELQARADAAKAGAVAAALSPANPAPPRSAPQRLEPRPLALPAAPLRSAAEPRSGFLLISTTPRGLLAQLDGAPLDLTPVRAMVRAGTHRVSLYDGERKVLETSVAVAEGEVATLRRDLTAEMAPAAPPESPLPAAGAPVDPSARVPGPVAPETSRAAAERGGLDVTSPGLYAEVWINGRSYGFPPVAARNLPAGTAEVEVRVNGAVKRKAKVVIEPGQVTAIKVR